MMEKKHVAGFSQFFRFSKSALHVLIPLLFAGQQAAAAEPTFTWVSGSGTGGEDMAHTVGIYGTAGIASVENSPGARQSAATWTDQSGNYWLYGGYCNTEFRTGLLSDMWKYSPVTNEWTWVSGSRELNQPTTHTAIGSFDPMNTPGARLDAAAWVGADGGLWLFGGKSTRENDNFAIQAGLWKYDPASNQWALMQEKRPDGSAVYGTRGTPGPLNTPGGRFGASSWVDSMGNFWLLGGYGKTGASLGGELNDLWRYNFLTGEWTWMKGSRVHYGTAVYGTRGTPGSDNTPTAITDATTWVDSEGDLWLLGGHYTDSFGSIYANTMWEYSVTSDTWTWISGEPDRDQPGTYGTLNVFAAANTPGARSTGTAWTDDEGTLWLFSGFGFGATAGTAGALNDLWKFDPAIAQWAWVGGSKAIWAPGVFGQPGVPAPANSPGGRRYAASWSDVSGNLWMYGGFGFNAQTEAMLNDLWKYDRASGNWTWLSGSDYPARYGRYGTALVASTINRPGIRSNGAMWSDVGGNLWVFGGRGYGGVAELGTLNDMWKYDPAAGTWTYVKGEFFPGHQGAYGTQGVIDASNTPSSREGSAFWTDPSGKYWLFGGEGVKGLTNDLWYFNPDLSAWEWVKGDEQGGKAGVYGVMGTPRAVNNPGSRTGAVCWTDNDGNLWLFGGYGNSGQPNLVGMLNDLWKFNRTTRQWTWINGSIDRNTPGTYGTRGVSNRSNKPGARSNAVAWKDNSGNFWLFGGNAPGGTLNDVWKYQVALDEWVWVHGDSVAGAPAAYGIEDVASPLNTPGARASSAGWTDPAGVFWLLGGKAGEQRLNDLWKFVPTDSQWTWVKGASIPDQTGIYGRRGISQGDGIPGAREDAFTTQDSQGQFWLFGGYGLDQRPEVSRPQGDLWLFESDPRSAARLWGLYD